MVEHAGGTGGGQEIRGHQGFPRTRNLLPVAPRVAAAAELLLKGLSLGRMW